jgi:hypothetical protein
MQTPPFQPWNNPEGPAPNERLDQRGTTVSIELSARGDTETHDARSAVARRARNGGRARAGLSGLCAQRGLRL